LSKEQKVIGIIQAYNEGPLLALSVSHALTYHVDEVFLLNHFRDHQSYGETRTLKKLWGDRLHVYDYFKNEYYQEAQTNALIEISKRLAPDWIWAFDADEFLLCPENQSLKKTLSEIDPRFSVVRYPLQNWVSQNDFNENRFDDFLKLQDKSLADKKYADLWSKVMHDEIVRGRMNFFDIPFNSKVIFRGNLSDRWLASGAHSLLPSKPAEEIATDQFEVAHFPLLSKNRLASRVSRRKQLTKQGFSTAHGWQSQMISTFHHENRIDEFWDAHSMSDNAAMGCKPRTEKDQRFVESIKPIISFLKDKLEAPESFPCSGEDTQVSFDVLVQSFRKFKLMSPGLKAKRSWWRLLKPSALWGLCRAYIKTPRSVVCSRSPRVPPL